MDNKIKLLTKEDILNNRGFSNKQKKYVKNSSKELFKVDEYFNVACVSCIECFNCTEMINSRNCIECFKGEDCLECYRCESVIACYNCNYCISSLLCDNCDNCLLCVECYFCFNCSNRTLDKWIKNLHNPISNSMSREDYFMIQIPERNRNKILSKRSSYSEKKNYILLRNNKGSITLLTVIGIFSLLTSLYGLAKFVYDITPPTEAKYSYLINKTYKEELNSITSSIVSIESSMPYYEGHVCPSGKPNNCGDYNQIFRNVSILCALERDTSKNYCKQLENLFLKISSSNPFPSDIKEVLPIITFYDSKYINFVNAEIYTQHVDSLLWCLHIGSQICNFVSYNIFEDHPIYGYKEYLKNKKDFEEAKEPLSKLIYANILLKSLQHWPK